MYVCIYIYIYIYIYQDISVGELTAPTYREYFIAFSPKQGLKESRCD